MLLRQGRWSSSSRCRSFHPAEEGIMHRSYHTSAMGGGLDWPFLLRILSTHVLNTMHSSWNECVVPTAVDLLRERLFFQCHIVSSSGGSSSSLRPTVLATTVAAFSICATHIIYTTNLLPCLLFILSCSFSPTHRERPRRRRQQQQQQPAYYFRGRTNALLLLLQAFAM